MKCNAIQYNTIHNEMNSKYMEQVCCIINETITICINYLSVLGNMRMQINMLLFQEWILYVAQKIKEPQIYYWKLHLFERQTKNQYVMFSVSCVSTTCSNTCTTSRRHAGYQATDCRPWNAPPFLLKCNTKIVKIDWLRLSSTNRSA